MNRPLALNADDDCDGIPVIIERPDDYPFAAGEREAEWHVASDDEITAYETYWNALYDAEEAARARLGKENDHA